MKVFIKNFFSKCDQLCRKLWIWSHLLKKSWMEKFFFFCSVEQISGKEIHKIVPYLVAAFSVFSHWGWNLVFKEPQVYLKTFFRKMKKILAEMRLLLSNLAVKKNINSNRKFCRQSVSKHFVLSWCFSKVSLQHKWNDMRLLLINMVYRSCLTSCQTTWDLES